MCVGNGPGPRTVHPDIVPELCVLCPALLEDLLDGMLWHSASVEKGKVRILEFLLIFQP